MTRTTHRRTLTTAALTAAAAMAAATFAPAASAQEPDGPPRVDGFAQGHVMQPPHKAEITHPVRGSESPIEFRLGVGCLAPDQVDPAGDPREGIFLATDDMTPTDPGLGSITDPGVLIPTSDTLTVTWTNHTTGESGEIVKGGQRLRTEARANTGLGQVTGTAVLATTGPLGGIGLGSLGGGADQESFDFDVETVPCIP